MKALILSDFGAGIGAIGWAILAVDVDAGPMVPQLAELCSAYVAGPFGFAALRRWYKGRRDRNGGAGDSDAR